MKHAQFLLAAVLLVVTGCNDDGDERPGPKQYVLKTITRTPPGVTHTVHYDERGRISEISHFDGGWIGTTFEYDTKGNLASGSNWYFTYDGLNRLIRITAGERIDELNYNQHGQLHGVTSHFDVGGVVISASYSYFYPNASTKNFTHVEYDYGATEQVEYENTPNPFQQNWMHLGAARFLEWDRLCYQTDNNIKRITMTSGLTTIVYHYRYTYNEAGYPAGITIETIVTTPQGTSTSLSDRVDLTYEFR